MFGSLPKRRCQRPWPKTINEVFAVLLFFGSEDPSEQWLSFHDFEEAIAYLDSGNSFGFAFACHDGIPTRVGGDIFKDTRLRANVSNIRGGDLIVLSQTRFGPGVAPYEHQAVGILDKATTSTAQH